jgi:hypothetical protein
MCGAAMPVVKLRRQSLAHSRFMRHRGLKQQFLGIPRQIGPCSNTAQPSKSSDFAIVFSFSDALELPGVLLLDESPDWWPRLVQCLGE